MFVALVCCTTLLGVVLIIPISMIAVGAWYFHDCALERYIPIYLVVAGVFGVLCIICFMPIVQRSEGPEQCSCVGSTISIFLLVWFIAG